MNVLVIGGAGYIGSHTVLELIAAGYRPVILDNLSNSSATVIQRLGNLSGQKLAFYQSDYQNKHELEALIQKEHIESVIHFAAFKAVAESVAEPLKYYDNNVAGFVQLLRVLLEHNINNFVFSSSAAVYGNPPTDKVTEDTPCAPESPYGWSKYMDEIILRDTCTATPELRGIALRYFNVVGAHPSGQLGESPKGKPQNLLPIIVQATSGKLPPLTVYGTDYPTPDGSCLRDYIHVVDLAKAHVAALQKMLAEKSGGYDVYNIGTGTPTSVLELIHTFEEVNGVKVPHRLGERRPGDPTAYYAVATKANERLGWHAEKTVEDAVHDAWRWQTTNPNGYES